MGSLVLDVGCGGGAFSNALAQMKRSVIALDIRKDWPRKIESSSLERICADAHHLPLREGSVDCVLSLSLLEHLENPLKCMEELYRVLRNGGTAIIQIPNLQYPFEPHTKWPLLYLLPKKFQSKIFEKVDYPYAINMKVTLKYVLSILRTRFKMKETIKIYHLNIMKLLPFAPAYIFIAEKVKPQLNDTGDIRNRITG